MRLLAILLCLVLFASPAHARSPEHVGFVGGSITAKAVVGYQDIGGSGFWPRYSVGGGTIDAWANDPDFFNKFEINLTRRHTDMVWWQLAFRDVDLSRWPTFDGRLALAHDVLEGIHRDAPGMPVYASAQAAYVDVPTCPDVLSPGLMADLVDYLVSEGAVLRGPVMPDLHRSDVMPTGCHQNEQGQRLHGQVLLDFFGA